MVQNHKQLLLTIKREVEIVMTSLGRDQNLEVKFSFAIIVENQST